MKKQFITTEFLDLEALVSMGHNDTTTLEQFVQEYKALIESTIGMVYPSFKVEHVGAHPTGRVVNFTSRALSHIAVFTRAIGIEDAVKRKNRLEYGTSRICSVWHILLNVRGFSESGDQYNARQVLLDNHLRDIGMLTSLGDKIVRFVIHDNKAVKVTNVPQVPEVNEASYFRLWTDGDVSLKSLEITAAARDWTPKEKAHAISCIGEGIDYKNEKRHQLKSGRVICVGSDRTYVRLVDQGFELGYRPLVTLVDEIAFLKATFDLVVGDGIFDLLWQ